MQLPPRGRALPDIDIWTDTRSPSRGGAAYGPGRKRANHATARQGLSRQSDHSGASTAFTPQISPPKYTAPFMSRRRRSNRSERK